jgi:hypothetical protein
MTLTFDPQRCVKNPNAKCYSCLTNGLVLIVVSEGWTDAVSATGIPSPDIEHQKSVLLVWCMILLLIEKKYNIIHNKHP